MTNDIADFFGGAVDLFGSEIDLLVVSVYEATILGIDAADKKARDGFETAGWTHRDEKSQHISWWEEQVSLLKYQAGNMGLVALITLFDVWMSRPGEEDLSIPKRFQKHEKDLGTGSLSAARFETVLVARNSIIHHSGAPTYEWNNKPKEVKE